MFGLAEHLSRWANHFFFSFFFVKTVIVKFTFFPLKFELDVYVKKGVTILVNLLWPVYS